MTTKYSAITVIAAATLLSSFATAQSTISGQVKDTSGAVMAGVTVQAASPALIEGSRTITTNGEGRYSIVDIRPGTYTMTFSFQGFASTIQSVEVPSSVTVPVDAEMRVGAVGETVNVETRVATVDTENAASPTVLTRNDIDVLPTARNMQSMGSYTAGVHLTYPDVGGTQQDQQTYLMSNGNTADRDSYVFDGMLINTTYNNGAAQMYINTSMIQEVTYQTSNISLDATGGGVYANFVPKDGGNTLHGDLFLGWVPAQFVGTNVDAALLARGLTGQSATTRLEDFDGSLQGPIKKDKLWFVLSGRKQQSYLQSGASFNLNGSPAIERDTIYAGGLRLTYQANPKNKFSAFWLRNWKTKLQSVVTDTGNNNNIDPYETSYTWLPVMYYVLQGKWTYTVTPRLLITAGANITKLDFNLTYSDPKLLKVPFTPDWAAYTNEDDIVTTAISVAGFGNYYEHWDRENWNVAGSYVTGSHQFKFGIQDNYGTGNLAGITNGDSFLLFAAGHPYAIDALNDPYYTKGRLNQDLGLYAQDTWHLKRLSITGGVRWEYLSAEIEHETAPAGRFVGARDFPAVTCSTLKGYTCFKNFVPRIGAVYDVFGNHKTALKAGWAKYNSPLTGPFPGTPEGNFNAMAAGTSEIVPWVGAPTTACFSQTGVPTPGCYPTGYTFNQGGIGASPNPNFGQVNNITLNPNFKREFQFQYNLGVQQELTRRITLTFNWNHMADYQQAAVNNFAVAPSAWTQFTAVNPLNGQPLPIFNLSSQYSNIVPILNQTNSSQSLRANSYNGFSTSVVARLAHGAFVLAAWTIDRSLNRACDETTNPQLGAALNDPNTLRFCDWTGGLYQNLGAVPTIPYRNEFKLQGSVPIRWGIQATGSLISDPVFGSANGQVSVAGGASAAISGFKSTTWSITSATRYPTDCNCPNPGGLVDPGLNPTQGQEVLQLVAPGTQFYPQLTQVDLGLRRVFKIHEKFTLVPEAQMFNILNSNTVLFQTTALGTTVKPFVQGGPGGGVQAVLNPRMLRLNLQFKF